MVKTIHPVAGALAMFTILSFWFATAFSELFAGAATVVMVKTLIPWGFVILLPALAAAGISGLRLGQKRRGPLVKRKQKRMRVIAANGLLVLVPSAFYLSVKAQTGSFDGGFYLVQALELVSGAVNIALLGLNMRDGLRLAGKQQNFAR